MTQREFVLSREAKQQALEAWRPTGLSARMARQVTLLIWAIEVTPPEARTAEVLAGRMGCSMRTYRTVLRIAEDLGAVAIKTNPGTRSAFWVNWSSIEVAGRQVAGRQVAGRQVAGRQENLQGCKLPETVQGKSVAAADQMIGPVFATCTCNVNEYVTCMEDAEGIAIQAKDYWGQKTPLKTSDLTEPASIERLFTYAVNRLRFQPTDHDRLRFEALCVYCVRRGKNPGGLLTKSVFGSADVQYFAQGRDEDVARLRIRERAPTTKTTALAKAIDDLARNLAARPDPPGPRIAAKTPAERVIEFKEWLRTGKRG